ncbi:MAG: cupin domain-containing protein [Solirubrobacterales bacterium]|nr:cupin domain-containing protein [Solirubrobacterales bacterium]
MIASKLDDTTDAYWWQGALMRIRARAADTGGAIGLVEGNFYEGFGPPLHIHHREDEGMLTLEGEITFRQGDREFTAGPGTLVWCPREVPHAFKVMSPSARALVIVTPAGFEEMFVTGGMPVSESSESPTHEYDPDAARALAEQFGFEVVGQ